MGGHSEPPRLRRRPFGLSSSISFILLEVVPFSCGPASHVSDDGLATFIHVHMLDTDVLRTAMAQTPESFDLCNIGPQ
jgi:hypothetical protein